MVNSVINHRWKEPLGLIKTTSTLGILLPLLLKASEICDWN